MTRNHPAFSQGGQKISKGKVVSAREAVELIQDGDLVAFGGFVGIGFAEEIAIELEKCFLETSAPKNIGLIYAAGMGDSKEKGLNHLAHPGLIGKVIGGHWGLAPKLQKLATDNLIEAWNLPQGVISHMYRDCAANKPRTITSVGLGTFVDPRNGGGKLNEKTKTDLVELIEFDDQEYLAYKPQKIQVGILRGTTADTDGNITMEKEALTLESLSLAMAVKNSGGIVIVQVERIAQAGTLKPKEVKIPSILVDCIVVSQPQYHWQTFQEVYNPSFTGETRIPLQNLPPMPLDERKIIARRVSFELKPNSVLNLGIGMPEGVANVAAEEKILDLLTLTAEPGLIGGIPAGGLNFGAGYNPAALIDQPYQFDFYDGGGLDTAVLGLAQVDRNGNLNVSKFGPKLAGAGGFINISQNARSVIFAGTFTAGGLQVAIEDKKLKILQEGKSKKFIRDVEHITFSGTYAAKKRQNVFYVTERCVFRFLEQELELIEIAPGIDLEKDILSQMDFMPKISPNLQVMDFLIFDESPMGLRRKMLEIPVKERLILDREENLFFVNFEKLSIHNRKDMEKIETEVEKILKPHNKKVRAIVNYDDFEILSELQDEYAHMVKRIVDRYYTKVTRYTTSAFLRVKLKDALCKRGIAPHIYENAKEARNALS